CTPGGSERYAGPSAWSHYPHSYPMYWSSSGNTRLNVIVGGAVAGCSVQQHQSGAGTLCCQRSRPLGQLTWQPDLSADSLQKNTSGQGLSYCGSAYSQR